MADEEPEYKVYRSRPRLLRKNEPDDGLAGLRTPDAPPQDYEVQRRRRLPSIPLPKRKPKAPGAPRPRITPGRVLKWVALALVAWVGVSAILFMVSAQLQRGDLAN